MKKGIDIVINSAFKATGINAAVIGMKKLAARVGKNLMNIKAGFDIAAGAWAKFAAALEKGMAFEQMTVRFKSLTGSLELAKGHMKDLQDLGRTPPFSLEQFAAASQAMLKMTGGMAGFKKEMEIVGDMAAATGNDIATVGRAFGLAYQVIRDGQDFGRAGQMLYSLGIMTKKQVAEFAELSKAGKDNAEVWAKLQEVFGRYHGAMAETEKTTKGLIDAIGGEATVAVTEFSAALSESAKPALEGLLGWMRRIGEDGTIEDWADGAASAITGFTETVKAALGPIRTFWRMIGAFDMAERNAREAIDKTIKGGGSILGSVKAVWGGIKRGFNDELDIDGSQEQSRRDRAEARRRKRAETAAKAEAEAARRQEEDLARAQEETERKAAEEKAKKDAEAAKKAEDARLKAVEAEKKAREQAEAELHKQRVDNIRAEVEVSQAAANGKQNIAQAAQSEFDRAFGWWRSEDKGAAAIAEERDYAADYKRLGREANRYGGKWRIDELAALMAAGDTKGQAAQLEEWRKSRSFTPEVESMVRAAAADKTRTTAEDELRKIEANTAGLKEKLDELLAMK